MNRRRLFAALGAVLLAGSVLLVVTFGLEGGPALVQVGLLVGASVLFIIGGIFHQLGPVAWYQAIGVGDILLSLSLVGGFAGTLTSETVVTEEVVAVGVATLGALSLAYIGVDWIRGGKHFDLSSFDSSLS